MPRKKPTFYSPIRKTYLKLPKEPIKPLHLSPALLDSPLKNKPFLITLNPVFITKDIKYLRSISSERFDLNLYKDQKTFERKLIQTKFECNNELDFLLQALTDHCLKEGHTDPQTV